MLADLRLEPSEAIAVATLRGEVDMSNADDIGTALLRGVTNERHALVLDLVAVTYFDSAGIHMLFNVASRLRVRGQSVALVVPDASGVRDALRMAGVEQALDVHGTLEAALEAVRR